VFGRSCRIQDLVTECTHRRRGKALVPPFVDRLITPPEKANRTQGEIVGCTRNSEIASGSARVRSICVIDVQRAAIGIRRSLLAVPRRSGNYPSEYVDSRGIAMDWFCGRRPGPGQPGSTRLRPLSGISGLSAPRYLAERSVSVCKKAGLRGYLDHLVRTPDLQFTSMRRVFGLPAQSVPGSAA